MCGIIGYTGEGAALPILLEGLAALEYRGYDSAGVAVGDLQGHIHVVKSSGRLWELERKIQQKPLSDKGFGIGHTRWATHGSPSAHNAHPHESDNLILVHNGIIENYADLAESLRQKGYDFISETDTEVAAKVIDNIYINKKDPLDAIFQATQLMRGSFAFAILFRDHPHTIYAIRRDSPLLAAQGGGGYLIASDLSALLPYTNQFYRLEENTVAVIKKEEICFFDAQKQPVSLPLEATDRSVEQVQRGNFPHFMLKEIHEEPEALRKTVSSLMEGDLPLSNHSLFAALPRELRTIHIVACGTAMHAGLMGKRFIEKAARIPVLVDIASEFRYGDPILHPRDLIILLSQSGETADTLAALRYAKKKGIPTLAIVNVVGSSIAREADFVLYTAAGPEIAVASTKAYSVQCGALYFLALRMGIARGEMDSALAKKLGQSFVEQVPSAIGEVLTMENHISAVARSLAVASDLFFIGRGQDYSVVTEASLKLKEISYIHSEAYAAGELKHGTIALITKGTPVIALMTDPALCEKTISAIREVKARGAHIIALCDKEIAATNTIPADNLITLPHVPTQLSPFPAATALQLLAYYTAAARGLDVDKPRNLAKSVTVE